MTTTSAANVTIFHADHSMSEEQRSFGVQALIDAISNQSSPFAAITITLPDTLGTVPNALFGPICGDEPITDDEVTTAVRNGRPWADRLVDRPLRPSSLLTVIGLQDGEQLKVFTMHGGPLAPQNPLDPNCADKSASLSFWATHALSSQGM
jgi:hypothetical protein